MLQPIGGLVLLPGTDDIRDRNRTFELNALGMEVVRRCDGSRTVEALLAEVDRCARGVGFEVLPASADLLRDLARRGMVTFTEQPSPERLLIAGSSEYFTPVHFSIELTDHCNLRCRHCYRESGPERHCFFPAAPLCELLETLAGSGVYSVELTGGEPLTHPDVTTIVRAAVRYFPRVALITNGTLLDDRMLAVLAETPHQLILQIDLDGDEAAVHDALRGVPGAFAAACRAARRVAHAGLKFRAAMNVYYGNVDRVRQTAALAQQLGAEWFAFAPVMPVGQARHETPLSVDQMRYLAALAPELEAAYPGFVRVTPEVPPEAFYQQPGNCGAGSRSLVIGPAGAVRPCLMLPESEGVFGNVLQEDYDSLIPRAALTRFYHLDFPHETTCGDCAYVWFCKGCFARPFHARAHAQRKQLPFTCRWDETTGGFDLLTPPAR